MSTAAVGERQRWRRRSAPGIDGREVALHVDDDVVAAFGIELSTASKMRSEPEAWSRPGHHRPPAGRLDGLGDLGASRSPPRPGRSRPRPPGARHARSSARPRYRPEACWAAGWRARRAGMRTSGSAMAGGAVLSKTAQVCHGWQASRCRKVPIGVLKRAAGSFALRPRDRQKRPKAPLSKPHLRLSNAPSRGRPLARLPLPLRWFAVPRPGEPYS